MINNTQKELMAASITFLVIILQPISKAAPIQNRLTNKMIQPQGFDYIGIRCRYN